jgi:hypothetical protein
LQSGEYRKNIFLEWSILLYLYIVLTYCTYTAE